MKADPLVSLDHSAPTRRSRLRKAFRENHRDLFPTRSFNLDVFEVVTILFFFFLIGLLAVAMSYESAVGGLSMPWSWLVLVAVGALSGPMAATMFFVTGFVGVSVMDFLIDETYEGRRRRERLRRGLRDVRSARRDLRRGLDGVKAALSVYTSSAIEDLGGGPWSRALGRLLRRRRRRLGARIDAVYVSSFADALAALGSTPSPRDETLVVWRRPYPVRTLAAERVLAEFSDGPVSMVSPPSPSVLLYTPRWVFDAVSSDDYSGREERLFFPGPRGYRGRVKPLVAVPLEGASRETIDKLYEPTGSGPMSDLAEVVRAALLLD